MTDNKETVRLGVTPATRRDVRLRMGFDPVTETGLEELDPDDTAIVVCVRVPAPHVAGAHKEKCGTCKHAIWVAASSPSPAQARRMCMTCFLKAAEQLEF